MAKRNFIQDIGRGWQAANKVMDAKYDYGHSVFNKQFLKAIREGLPGKTVIETGPGAAKKKVVDAVAPVTKPGEFLGAYAARVLTDAADDATRRIYWRFNHPMPIVDKVVEQVIGEKAATHLRPKKYKGSGRFTDTERSGIKLAGYAVPTILGMGYLDITNPEEQFRPKGFAQKYSEVGSKDRRKTGEPIPEILERTFLGRSGRPLKYETAKEDIPSLTPKRYGEYMRTIYQNPDDPIFTGAATLAGGGLAGLEALSRKGAKKLKPAGVAGRAALGSLAGGTLGLISDKLGLIKGTAANLEGHPEVRIVGFPFGLESAAAATGGAVALKGLLSNPKLGARTILAGSAASSLGGYATGNLINTAIAQGSRPTYPSTREYGVS